MNVKYKGKDYKSLKALAEAYGVKYSTFNMRRKAGYGIEESLEGKILGPDGKRYVSDRALSEAYNVRPDRYAKRKKKGWTLEECVNGKQVKK